MRLLSPLGILPAAGQMWLLLQEELTSSSSSQMNRQVPLSVLCLESLHHLTVSNSVGSGGTLLRFESQFLHLQINRTEIAS